MKPHYIIVLVIYFLPELSLAHVESGIKGDGGFISGLSHPVTGVDHILAMVAVGLWGAILRAPAIWLLPVVFPLIMTVGAVLGVLDIQLPGIDIGIAASAIFLGLMVAFNVRLPLIIAFSAISIFAVFHGHPHGTALPDFGVPLHYAFGFVLSTGLLHLSGILLGCLYKWPAGQMIVKSFGVMIALGGLYFLINAFNTIS